MKSLALLMMLGSSAWAAWPGVLDNKPCAAQSGTYEDYVARYQKETQELVDTTRAHYAQEKNPSPEARASRQKHLDEIMATKPMEKAKFDEAFHDGKLWCERFVYASDGLKVVGYSLRPEKAGKLPVVMFLRGGNRALGKIDERMIATFMVPFARAGFLVVAPQYRQTEESEGKDEFGGADVDDVLNLAELTKKWPDVDEKNLFVYGVSRGGMMTYIALHRGLKANAAVVHAGPADLENEMKARPDFDEMWREMMPRYREARAEVLRDRSAVNWADELTVPILILQGTGDWRVVPTDALRVAEKLQAKKREYGLIMYSGDDHRLTHNFEDVIRQSLKWFVGHRK